MQISKMAMWFLQVTSSYLKRIYTITRNCCFVCLAGDSSPKKARTGRGSWHRERAHPYPRLPKLSLVCIHGAAAWAGLTSDITNTETPRTRSLQHTDLTNNGLMFCILTFDEISKEIFTTGFFQGPDLCEIIIIFQPTKNRSGHILKIHY